MIVEFYTETSFKEKGAPIFIRLFQKHDAVVVLGIPNAKKTEYKHFSKYFICTFAYRASFTYILQPVEHVTSVQY